MVRCSWFIAKIKGYLKKQSQFAGGANWLNCLFERILWQYFALVGSKKAKPIQSLS
jgi:hypothetical protein